MKVKKYLAIVLLTPVLARFNIVTTDGMINKNIFTSCDSISSMTSGVMYPCTSCDSISSANINPDGNKEPSSESLASIGEWIDHADLNFFYGDGLTEETAFEIANASQLALLSQKVNLEDNERYYYYKIVADIDLGKYFWNAIGSADKSFYGSIDGNGFKISNLRINKQNDNCQGLFGSAKEGSCFKNLTIENCSVYGDFYVGSIVGLADGVKVDSCTVKGVKIQANFNLAGGIIGLARKNCIISNCRVESAMIMGGSFIGCFCGDPRGISMNGCIDKYVSVINFKCSN